METFVARVTVLAANPANVQQLPPELISKYGGTIVFSNDNLLIVIFGIDERSADPVSAVRAALAMKRALRRNEGRVLSIAIITGEVLLDVNDDESYEANGDALEMALRLLKVTRPGEILLDDASRDIVELQFHVTPRKEASTKGKSEAFPIFIINEDAVSIDLPPIAKEMQQIKVGTGGENKEEAAHQSDSDSNRNNETLDEVDCTVFAPPAVSRSENFLVQVFVHMPEETEEARQIATEFDNSTVRRVFKSLSSRISHGTKLTFELTLPGLNVDDSFQSIIWRGRTESVQFGVTVPEDFQRHSAIGTVIVSENSVPVGHLKFKLDVVPAADSHASKKIEPAADSARRYGMVFISYASKDRDEVLRRVQMLRPLGIRYFQDILDLEPGDRWEKELYRHIDECDLFLLFWSNAAKESKWVMKEVKYALARKGEDEAAPPEICPIIIEGPPIPLPPAELSHIHFNDRTIYFLSDPRKQ